MNIAPPQMVQQPLRVNLTKSLPVNYSYQLLMQQLPTQMNFFNFIVKTFHFVKNCIDNAKGAKNENGSIRLWRNPVFEDWFRALLGASNLPLMDNRAVVNALLNVVPNLPADIQQDCGRFIAYYRRQWANNLQYVNYWDNGFGGPRTTNGCEGFHSKLNVTIPDKDPTLLKVYNAYRDMFMESVDDYAYIRDKPPEYLRTRKAQYVESESRIIAARQSMLQTLQLQVPIPFEVMLQYSTTTPTSTKNALIYYLFIADLIFVVFIIFNVQNYIFIVYNVFAFLETFLKYIFVVSSFPFFAFFLAKHCGPFFP